VSKGHIVWTPFQKQFSYWLNWNDFGKIAIKNGQKRKAIF
jgi:hypothetical protein